MVKWNILSTPKSIGGLGITDLEAQNTCLLSKWLFKLLNEEGTWQQLLKKKYLSGKTLTQVTKQPGDSQFWGGLLEIKEHFLQRGKFQINNGKQARFWEDWWLGSKPLMQQYPSLYNIVRRRNQTVASALGSIPLNISFRRALVGDKLGLWHELVSKVMNIVLTDANDYFKWTLTQNSFFAVKSMYRDLMLTNSLPCNSLVWKIKVPLKIKIFLWYLQKGVTLTKDNLLKRR